jgi:RES domain-containing protein
MSEGQEAYNVGIFHHLEAARQLHKEQLVAALAGTKHVALKHVAWSRIQDYRYSMTPLSLVGSLMQGGRFNIGNDIDPSQFPAFPALYVAEDYETAYAEKFAMLPQRAPEFAGHELALRHPGSFTHVRLNIVVVNLFDLTKPRNLLPYVNIIKRFTLTRELKELARQLGIPPPWLIRTAKKLNGDLLTPNWRFWPAQFEVPANSQVFGRALNEAGFAGVLYPSVRGKGRCAAIFPQHFAGSASKIQLADDPPPGVHHSVLDEHTYRELAGLN